MSETLCVRGVRFGEGSPKICVPLVDREPDTLIVSAILAKASGADLVEWRVDCMTAMEDIALLRTVRSLRAALKDTPLLLTFRSVAEGGAREIKRGAYAAILRLMIASECIDLVDVELSCPAEMLELLVGEAKAKGVAVVISSHELYATPPKEAMVSRLKRMRQLGADLPKLAVTPQRFVDVLSLLAISEEFGRETGAPFISMSMGLLGQLSRVSGHFTGSAVSFASSEESSAPGQLPVSSLREILRIFDDEFEKNAKR